MATETGHHASRPYQSQDGAFHLNSGAFYSDAEVDISGNLETVVGGVAAGYKVARGEIALDGSNPTSITSGLTTVVGCAVSLKGSSAPGVSTCCLSAVITDGTIAVYAWKPTATNDCTLIASTGTETIYWVAVGV